MARVPGIKFYVRCAPMYGSCSPQAADFRYSRCGNGLDHWRTQQHHLAAGDYSRWVRDATKDDDLAAELAEIERNPEEDALASRERIKAAIERRYSGPA